MSERQFESYTEFFSPGGAGWFIDDVRITGLLGVLRRAVRFPVVTAGDTVSGPVVVRNFTGASLPLQLSIAGGPFAFSPGFRDSLLQGITLEPDSTLGTRVLFAPESKGSWSGSIDIVRPDTADTLAAISLAGAGRDIGFGLAYPPGEIRAGEAVPVTITMADSVHVDSVVVFHAQGGARSFERVTTSLVRQDPVSDWYQVAIPGTAAGPRGLCFYATAYNGPVARSIPPASAPIALRTRVPGLRFATPQPAGVYRMISLPLELPINTIPVSLFSDDLGPQSDKEWRIFSWDTSLPGYREAPLLPIERGRSYWLITRRSAELDTDPIPGSSTATDSSFGVSLRSGWNMLANPFDFPVEWRSILIDGVPTGLDTLVELPWAWSTSPPRYVANVSELRPFEGYWVWCERDSARLTIPAVEVARAAPGPSQLGGDIATQSDASLWEMQFVVSTCGVEDRCNVVALRSDAASEWDRLDRSEPPPGPGNSVCLYFPHFEWPRRPGYYTMDFRAHDAGFDTGQCPTGPRAFVWNFDLAKNFVQDPAGDDVVLEVRENVAAPAPVEVLLVDRLLNRVIDPRHEPRYSFFLGKKSAVSREQDCRFSLLVGCEASLWLEENQLSRVPAITALLPNVPNPFNAATRIEYDLARAGDVDLGIFDARGALVRRLERAYRLPGRYALQWNGLDDRGRLVGSGVYFCRLRTPELTRTRKLSLAK